MVQFSHYSVIWCVDGFELHVGNVTALTLAKPTFPKGQLSAIRAFPYSAPA